MELPVVCLIYWTSPERDLVMEQLTAHNMNKQTTGNRTFKLKTNWDNINEWLAVAVNVIFNYGKDSLWLGLSVWIYKNQLWVEMCKKHIHTDNCYEPTKDPEGHRFYLISGTILLWLKLQPELLAFQSCLVSDKLLPSSALTLTQLGWVGLNPNSSNSRWTQWLTDRPSGIVLFSQNSFVLLKIKLFLEMMCLQNTCWNLSSPLRCPNGWKKSWKWL